MKLRIILLVFLPLLAAKSYGQAPSRKSIAKKIIESSMRKMGSDAWNPVQSLLLDGYGYENTIDESERPEGPYIPGKISRSILKDLSHDLFSIKESQLDYNFESNATYLVNDQYLAVKNGNKLLPTKEGDDLQDDLNLSPELVLKKAEQAPDLLFLKDTVYQQAQHHILFFKYHGYPARVYINKETDLLTAVELIKPYQSGYAGVWGDVKRTNIYSFWMLLGKGLHYPLQQDTYLNGWYKSSFLVNKWEVNPKVSTDSLQIPDSVREMSKQLAQNAREALKKSLETRAKQLAPGIWLLRGPCNVSVVEQSDGLVIIESPCSSSYGEDIISKAKALFPGKKIKTLITTSDAWLHIGGMRTFATIPGIKIYHPWRNKFIIDKLLKATFVTEPDKLAKTPKPSYTLAPVTDRMTIGTGANQMIMYAYKTETGDRQMMVYFPQLKMLYASDHYQPKGRNGAYWNPEITNEVYHSILDRKLDVKQFYAMHSAGLIPFSELEDDVRSKME